jgi:hypothetical protein
MDTSSKKYGHKKQNKSKENSEPSKNQGVPKTDTPATQDDTGGSHSTGKRIDDN